MFPHEQLRRSTSTQPSFLRDPTPEVDAFPTSSRHEAAGETAELTQVPMHYEEMAAATRSSPSPANSLPARPRLTPASALLSRTPAEDIIQRRKNTPIDEAPQQTPDASSSSNHFAQLDPLLFTPQRTGEYSAPPVMMAHHASTPAPSSVFDLMDLPQPPSTPPPSAAGAVHGSLSYPPSLRGGDVVSAADDVSLGSALPPLSQVLSLLTVSAPSSTAGSPGRRAHFQSGFNASVLVEWLKILLCDRILLEKLIIVQDAEETRLDTEQEAHHALRLIVAKEAIERHHLETEQMQRDVLDELQWVYGSAAAGSKGENYVTNTRAALHSRIELAEVELKEVEEALVAVELRIQTERVDADTQLVELLASIRDERRIIMSQLREAEAAKHSQFHAAKDVLIDSNYVGARSFAAAPRDMWVTRMASGASIPVAPKQQLQPAPQQQPLWSPAKDVLQLHSSTLAVGGRSALATSAASPLAVAPNHLHHSIDVLFPLPPLRADLEDIQKEAAPAIASVGATSALAMTALGTSSSRVLPSNGVVEMVPTSIDSQKRVDEREGQQQAAAFYRSFLAASRPHNQGVSTTSSRQNSDSADVERSEVLSRLTHTLTEMKKLST